jgi:glycosyltransferase involved in cell wall biosynthesis
MVIAPSLAEGFGSVHSEVCAMGKPLITTQVAAIPEVVSGHVKCVQPCSREAIIQAVEEMRNEIATQTGTRLPPKVFDWNMSVQRLEGLY